MLNIRHICHQNKGLTLIEVILTLAISSILIIPIYSIFNHSVNTCDIIEEKDELMLNGRYAIEYIKNEIRSADVIFPSDMIEGLNVNYPTNIGFVIMTNKKDGYNRYITYHTKGDKLIRIACNFKYEKHLRWSSFQGFNAISEYVESINNTYIDLEQAMIHLDFKFKDNSGQKLRLKTTTYIRCPINNGYLGDV